MATWQERTTYGDPGGMAEVELRRDPDDDDIFHVYAAREKHQGGGYWWICSVHIDMIPHFFGFNPITALNLGEDGGPWKLRIETHIRW